MLATNTAGVLRSPPRPHPPAPEQMFSLLSCNSLQHQDYPNGNSEWGPRCGGERQSLPVLSMASLLPLLEIDSEWCKTKYITVIPKLGHLIKAEFHIQ